MIHKLSDKIKIILAVMAVVVVAAGAVTYTALSANANDAQDSLLSGSSNGANALANANVVITSDTDVQWSSTLAEAETRFIGRYDTYFDGGFVDLPITSAIEVKSGTISDIQITGETFEGDPITDIYGWDFASSIELTQAGKYTAVVTMDDGSAYTYYAQVGKKQMDPFVSFDEDVYTGDKISFEVRVCQSQVFDLGTVVNLENIDNDIRGYDCENNPITEITPDTDNMTFVIYNVINAGRYEIPLTILDEAFKNYEWANAPDSLTATAVFNVKQAVVSGSTSVISTDYTTNMSVADLINRLQFEPISDPDHNNVQTGKYKVEYNLYTAPIYDDAHLVTALSAGQTVYVKAVGLSSIGGGNTAYRNYRLPAQDESGFNGITETITLKSPPLPAINLTADGYTKHAEEIGFPIVDNALFNITGETITATYLNFGYKFSQWFYSADAYNVEHNYWELSLEEGGYARGGNWVITVNGEEIKDPDSYVMKDSGTYNIVIKPKSGYSFDGVSQYKYTFTIRPFTLDGAYVKWTSWRPDNESGVKHFYTGSPIPFGKDDYELDLPALLAVDNDKLTLTFEQIVDGEVVNEAPTKAGSYTFRVKGVYGDNVSNYQLPLYDISNTGQEFYIYRQMLPDFSLTPTVQGTFNGALQTEFLEEKLIELNLGHYNDEGNFVPFFQQMPNIRIERSLDGRTFENDALIGYNSETFRYCFDFTYAGNYSIEIIATELLNNYCWFGKDDTPLSGESFDSTRYVWNNFAIIAQAEVDPLFTPTSISTKDDDIGIAAQIANKFKGLTDSNGDQIYTLTFGKVGTSDTSSTPMDKVDGAYAEGDYYVIIDIKEGYYPSCYFAENDAYTVNGSRARINYSVSSSTVSFNCNVTDYTFGDSFEDGFGVEDVFAVKTSTTDGANFDAPVYTFYDEQRIKLDPSNINQMVNGLPRNAGVYYVVITIDYSIDGVPAEQPLSREVTLNVAKRQVGLDWMLDGGTEPVVGNSASFAYDGTSHTVTVKVNTNGLPAVNATLVGEAAINVATHTFTVENLVGDEADNYTLGDIDTVFTIVIIPAEVTVTAGNIANITFNEGILDPNDLKFDVTSGSFYGDDGNDIKVAVYDKNGRLVSESQYANLGMGAYRVVPVLGEAPATMPSLTDGKYITSESANYVITIITSTFNVTAQTLQITFKDGQSNVYGDTAGFDLWTLIDSVMAGSAPMNVETLKNIAAIVVRKDGAEIEDITKAGVGSYTLAIKLDSGDYDVVITNPDATYKISPRPVTIRTTEVLNHRYGDRYQSDYNRCEIDGLLEGDSITVASHVYSFKNSQWVRLSNGEVPVTPVGQYYHVPQVNGVVIGIGIGQTPMQQGEDGKYYYVVETGNYIVTAHVESFVITVRAITLTFNNGESVYGEAINLWAQQSNLSDADKRSKFIYFTASGLINGPEPDSLVDVVTVCLVDGQGNEYDPSSTRIDANTYGFKIKVKSGADYVIYNGSEDVTEIIGGQFAVSPKSVAVTVTSKIGSQNATSIVYGDSLEACGITLGCTIPGGAILSGDDLGATVGIFNSDDMAIADISKQGVGEYYVGLVWTNANYSVTFNKISFTIEQRIVNIGANNVTSHIYGETFDLSDITWTEATANGHGDAIVNNDDLDIIANVYNASVKVTDFSRLAVKDGGYAIKLSKGANSDPNYKINFTDGVFTVEKRSITIEAQNVENHSYGSGWTDNDKYSELKYKVTSILQIVNDDSLNIELTVIDENKRDVTDKIAELSIGTYTIKITASNDNYDITTVNAELKIVVLHARVTFKNEVGSVYGETVSLEQLLANNVVCAIEGLLDGDRDKVALSIVNKADPSISVTDANAPAGEYVVTVTLGSNYQVEYVNWTYDNSKGVYTVEKRKVEISAQDVSYVYGDEFNDGSLDGKWTATTSNGTGSNAVLSGNKLNITANVYDGGAIVANGNVCSLDVNTYTIKLSYTPDDNYEVTQVNDAKFAVNKREITVVFGNGGTNVYGQTVDLYKSVDSVSNVLPKHNWTDIVQLSAANDKGEQAAQYSSVGSYTVVAAVSAEYNGNYTLAANQADGSYEITNANIQITKPVESGKTIVFNGQAHSFSTVEGVQADGVTAVKVEYLLVNKGVVVDKDSAEWANATTTEPQVTNVGSYTVYVRLSAVNHNNGYIQGDIFITKATITITAKDVTLSYGSELAPHLASPFYTVSTTLGNDIASGYLANVTYNADNYNTSVGVGTAGIKITPICDSSDDNVNVVCVSGSITVTEAEITINSVTSGYNDKYNGEAHAYFGSLSATAVNGQPITWWYSEVTSNGAENWTEYKNDTFTNVCSKQFKVKATAPNHAEKVYGDIIDFVIEKNSITITANDTEITYGDELVISELKSVISYAAGQTRLSSAAEAYYLGKIVYSVDYDKTSTNVGSVDIVITCESDDNVDVIKVNNGTLKVRERSVTIRYNNGLSHVYGETAVTANELYQVINGEFVNGYTPNVTALNGGNSAFAPYSNAGTYVVSVTASSNYTITYDNGESGTYVVNPRVITVTNTTPAMPFTPLKDADAYKAAKGAYGEAHNAVLSFGDAIEGKAPEYTVTYGKNGEQLASAPTVAGVYTITVELSDGGNYIFADGESAAELVFEVTKIELHASELVWNETMKVLKEDESITTLYNNFIPNYDNVIMDVVEVVKITAGQSSGIPMGFGDKDTANTYYFDSNGRLCITAQGRARYVARFKLSATALINYEINGADEDGVAETTCIIVDKEIVVSIITQNWQYGDEPVKPIITVNGEEPLYGVTYKYARLTASKEQIEAILAEKGEDFKGFDLSRFEGLYDVLTDELPEFDVGYYLICVTYDGLKEDSSADENISIVTVTVCDVIEVEKKQLSVSLTLEKSTFNGNPQWKDIDVEFKDISHLLIIEGSMSGSSSIMGTIAGTYTATVRIKDPDRYVWADDMNANGDEVTVIWEIVKDERDNSDNRYFEVDGIAAVVYGNDVVKSNPTLKDGIGSGYGNSFKWYFADKGSFESATDAGIVWRLWTETDKPVNAGGYFAKAVLYDDKNGGKNFTDKIAYGVFTIDKATLYLTPSGKIEYGSQATQEDCEYTVSGLIDADKGNEKNIIRDVNEHTTITYVLVDDYGNSLSESIKKKLAAGTYNLIVRTTGNGYVYGLVADNYNIVMTEGFGEFKVTRKTIQVTIGSASGQFGLPHNVSNVTVTYDGEVDHDLIISEVAKHLKTDAEITSTCGKYSIYAEYNTAQNNNFVIEYTNGEYLVTPRKVTVTLTNGGGSYKGEITAVSFIAEIVGENGANIALGDDAGFVISVWYNGLKDVPSNAGSYTVTVTADGNDNYALANDPTLTFIIEKFNVDVSKISVQTKVYDGTARKPEILIEADADFTADIFRVTSDYSGFITAKDYPVELKLDDFDNYKWSDSNTAYTTVTFTIDLAGIYAKPFGEMTYGSAFDKHLVQWEFVYAESGKAVPEEEIINIDYDALSFMFDQDIDLDRPSAKTYGITCAVDATGRVIGLSNGNFNITLQKNNGAVIYGEFVVNPKEITIIAGSSQSIYSQDPASHLSYGFTLDLTIDGNSLADGEILTDIIKQYTPSVNANVNSNAGVYTVTATAQADNYTVTVKSGAHEIVPITVKAVLEATNGVYNTTNVTYGVKELIATNLEGGYSFGSILDGKLTFDITGTLNSGASYVYDGSLPKDAGRYVVTVTAVIGSKNFALDENDWVQTASFVINKKTIDESEIVNVDKVYNGRDQSHGIANGEGYTVSEKMFKNVGEHNVTLTLTDSNNYEWSDHKQDVTITRIFNITKATLTLKPHGTITYGESFDENVRLYGFTLDNLQGDDVGKDNDEIVSGTVKYLLANGIDGTKLYVKDGGYVMIADVSGLNSDNYYIKAADGLLIVNKRAISIQPDSSESVYGEQAVVSQTFKVVNGELANGDDKSVIEYLASTVATETSDAGAYAVTAVASNGNYDITVLNGTHTIKRAKVGVQIRPVNGTYGNDNGSLVKFMSTVVINSDNTTKPISHLQFVISYDGTANDGTDYIGREAPTKAGIYIATVVEVLSGNYELDASYGISSTAVEICKRQIDASLITAENAAYTGKAIVPEINDSNYNVDGKVIYRAELDGEYVNVHSYDITLSLVDVDNYEWVDNLNKTTTIKFNIVKAQNSLIDVNNPNAPSQSVKVIISDWTFGGEVSKPIANVASGDSNIVFEYSTSENGAYTTEVPQNAGEYWVRATVAASDNYNAFVSGSTRFVISKKTVASPVVTNLDANSVYTGSMLSLTIDGFDDQIMSLTLDEDMYRSDNNGKLNLLALNANTYTAVFKLRNADNYEWSDNAQLVDGAVVVNWTVERQVIKRLPNAEHKLLVNGEDIVFIPEGFNSGIMTIEGNVHAHEGYFTAVITLKDTTNYVWEGTDSPSITVDFELTGTNTAFIAAICVVSGLCVGLATMAVILTLVNRRKKRKQAEAIDARSRAEGWEEE